MREIRAVINQAGVCMELHGHTPAPVTLALLRPSQLGRFRDELAETNPDMRHATIGQLAIAAAREMFAPQVAISPHAWTYNASEDVYSHA